MSFDERAVVFDCQGAELVGVVAEPRERHCPVGVIIVVGGPQYRVGSHRQFTLLARHLAAQGIASLRFDYHGSGDSDGTAALGIDGIEPDLRAAIDVLLREAPALQGVVLWGLCGAASASAIYAPADARVAGLVMLNPWVRTEQGRAKAELRHYYLARALDREFWARLARGDVALLAALGGLVGSLARALGLAKHGPPPGSPPRTEEAAPAAPATPATPEMPEMPATSASRQSAPASVDDAALLPERMLAGLRRAGRPVLVVLSGDQDMTANEFRDLRARSAPWRRYLASAAAQCTEVEGSNHTFARSDWRDEVAALTTRWVLALSPPARR